MEPAATVAASAVPAATVPVRGTGSEGDNRTQDDADYPTEHGFLPIVGLISRFVQESD
jgi:hypothetical protein